MSGLKRIVFVGGAHGVGKTTLCKTIAQSLGVTHRSAGELIKQYREQGQSGKQVLGVEENQIALIQALHELATEFLILDGHFCVLDSANGVSAIPIQVFEHIDPVAAVVIYDDVTEIQRRLKNRDSVEYDPDVLTRLQSDELNNAHAVCRQLAIPLLAVTPGMVSVATDTVRIFLFNTQK
jgi:adenylate kinase